MIRNNMQSSRYPLWSTSNHNLKELVINSHDSQELQLLDQLSLHLITFMTFIPELDILVFFSFCRLLLIVLLPIFLLLIKEASNFKIGVSPKPP